MENKEVAELLGLKNLQNQKQVREAMIEKLGFYTKEVKE